MGLGMRVVKGGLGGGEGGKGLEEGDLGMGRWLGGGTEGDLLSIIIYLFLLT